jgi:hypothetical protein
VATVVTTGAVLVTRTEEQPKQARRITTPASHPRDTRGYGRADWDALVAQTRQTGRIAMPPLLRDLRAPADALRGTSVDRSPALHPAGEAVESQQPRFTWPAIPDARYRVRVFAGRSEIARSPSLATAEWTSDRLLRRGVTYAWQIEVPERDIMIPSPPASPALFRVIDENSASELAEARHNFPRDHLLAGILCARAGMQRPAVEELTIHAAEHPDDRFAAKLLASVRSW